MRKFVFRLQTLLDHRKTVEDQKLAELAEVRQEEAREVARLAELNVEVDTACERLKNALDKRAGMAEVTRWDEYVKTLRDDIAVQELTIKTVCERIEQKRQEVVTAMKDRQALESLRDKQQNEFELARARAEQNTLDEMASLRYARGTL